MSSNHKNMINFPDDLVEQILLRLQPNYLVRFKAICKCWKLLIESPRFIDLNHRQPEETLLNNQLLSIISNKEINTIELKKFVGKLSQSTKEYHASYRSCSLANGTRLIGSCNGLLCFTDNRKIFIYTRSTQVHYPVPYPTSEVNFFHFSVYGFAYDDYSTYDYKIVNIVWIICPVERTCQVHVYSLNTKTWKSLEGYPDGHIHSFACSRYCAFVNNALHWVVTGEFIGQNPLGSLILRFDLSSEKFSLLAWPRGMEVYANVDCNNVLLDVVGGCMSASCRHGADVENLVGLEC